MMPLGPIENLKHTDNPVQAIGHSMDIAGKINIQVQHIAILHKCYPS